MPALAGETITASVGGATALLAAAILVVCAFTAAAAPAAQAGPPLIEGIGSGAGAEVTIEASIDPEGLETTYELGLECSPCGSGNQWTKGTLPAVSEAREVTLALTGLQPNRRYWFAVRAANADGEESRRSETIEMPSSPAPFPNGTAPAEVIQSSSPGLGSSELIEIAVKEEQQRANEREEKEQRIKELDAAPASARDQGEQAPPADTKPELPACRVPALKGDTLTAARRALAKAHCRTGAIHKPAHYHGTLYVSAQGAAVGKRLPHGALVALTLGANASGTKQTQRRD